MRAKMYLVLLEKFDYRFINSVQMFASFYRKSKSLKKIEWKAFKNSLVVCESLPTINERTKKRRNMQPNHFHIHADAPERNNSTVCSLIDRRRRFIYPPPSETAQPINCQIKPYHHSIFQLQTDTCNRKRLTIKSQTLINTSEIGRKKWL